MQRLLKHKGPYNLSRDKEVRFEIRELAQKRFTLGYPPRKQGDQSTGDAINWEWIVRCAEESGSGVVIVTRDSDYGLPIGGKPALNDQLREEFKGRVGKKRKIVLTDRLSVAMKDAAITLTKKEEEAETALIKVPEPSPRSAIQAKLLELMGLKQTTVDALLVQHTPEAEDA